MIMDLDDLKIFKMKENDVKEVFKIENELLKTSDEKTISQTLSSNTLTYYVLKNKDEVIGFLEVSIIEPECELFDIAIKSEYQGKKLSIMLMDYLFNLCKERHCETIFLEVNNINNKAINLYKKYGFKEYFVRKNYYGENDAILMKVEI